jgi:hypothetical protein
MEKLPNFKQLDGKFTGKWNDSIYPSFHRAVYELHHVQNIGIRALAKIIGAANSSCMAAAERMGIHRTRITFKVGGKVNIEKLHSDESLLSMDKSVSVPYNRTNLLNGCLHLTIKSMYESNQGATAIAKATGLHTSTVYDCLRRMQIMNRTKRQRTSAKAIRIHAKSHR